MAHVIDRRRLAAWALLGTTLTYVGCSAVLTTVSRVEGSPRPDGSESLASGVVFLLAVLAFAAVGFLIVREQPANAIGWLLGANGLLLGWLDLTSVVITFAVRDGAAPSDVIVTLMALTNWTWVPSVGLLAIFVVLLFPDGHLPSARWRRLPRLAVAVMAVLSGAVVISPSSFDNSPLDGEDNPFAVGLPSWVVAAEGIVFALFVGCMLASAAAAVGRYRRSGGVERLQMKWLALAGAFMAGVFGLIALAGFVPSIEENEAMGSVVDLALPFAILAVPLAVGAAVLKHGLYEIDVVINKSVVLGTLAAFITVVYVGIVVGVGSLVGRGERPNLALSIAATAVVAVAFQPVRNRVQRFANRLVYGERATPYEVLSDFADRMRGAYAAGDLLPLMARTVAEGVGASRAEVWLAVGSGLVRESAWPLAPTDGVPVGASTVERIGDLDGERVVPVRHRGELLGAITVRKPAGEAMSAAEDKLLGDVAAQAGLVLRNVRLIEELRGSRQRLVTTQDAERRRLERNLHDGAQQSLVAVALMLRMVRSRVGDDATGAGASLDRAADQLGLALEELRELARGIHPAILTERGLGPALSSLAERSPVPVVLGHPLPGRLPADVEATLYLVAAEALRHASTGAASTGPGSTGAPAEVTLSVSRTDGRVRLDVTAAAAGGLLGARRWLRGLEDRVSVLDGALTSEDRSDGGWHLACTVPVSDSQPQVGTVPTVRTTTPLGAAT